MAKALLLIDFQRDFLLCDGRMPVAGNQIDNVIAAARNAVADAQAIGAVIVAIGNEFPRSSFVANFFRRNAAIAGSPGAQWDERVPRGEAKYFRKWRSSAFCNPALESFLRAQNVGELTLAGLYAKACVAATAKGALARGFQVNILADAVADSSDSARDAALRRLSRCGAKVVQATVKQTPAHTQVGLCGNTSGQVN
ncbi:MAG TPA: isochorismatase family cysteine hydrolase [Terriglobales bacterium]